MIFLSFAVLAVAALLVAAYLGVGLGFERGYRAAFEDLEKAERRTDEIQRAEARKSAYLRYFGGQINAGKRGEN